MSKITALIFLCSIVFYLLVSNYDGFRYYSNWKAKLQEPVSRSLALPSSQKNRPSRPMPDTGRGS